jgi:hypothetical protein
MYIIEDIFSSDGCSLEFHKNIILTVAYSLASLKSKQNPANKCC